jgi:hypothetical protein
MPSISLGAFRRSCHETERLPWLAGTVVSFAILRALDQKQKANAVWLCKQAARSFAAFLEAVLWLILEGIAFEVAELEREN